MWYILELIWVTLLSGCITSHPQSKSVVAKPSECMSIVTDKNRSGDANFYGYGEAYDPEGAADAARGDLARQITTKVQSETNVSDDGVKVEVSSLTSSSVSQIFTGLKIVQRCHDDNKHAAVAKLPRRLFTKNLNRSLERKLAQSEKLLSRATKAQSTGETLSLVYEAKQFVGKHAEQTTADYDLCRLFRGCIGLNISSMIKLKDFIHQHKKLNAFKYEPLDALATDLRSPISSLLGRKGIHIDQSSKGSLRVSCRKKVFPKMENLNSQIVEVTCQTVGTYEGLKLMEHHIEARGIGESIDSASEAAKANLEFIKKEPAF